MNCLLYFACFAMIAHSTSFRPTVCPDSVFGLVQLAGVLSDHLGKRVEDIKLACRVGQMAMALYRKRFDSPETHLPQRRRAAGSLPFRRSSTEMSIHKPWMHPLAISPSRVDPPFSLFPSPKLPARRRMARHSGPVMPRVLLLLRPPRRHLPAWNAYDLRGVTKASIPFPNPASRSGR